MPHQIEIDFVSFCITLHYQRIDFSDLLGKQALSVKKDGHVSEFFILANQLYQTDYWHMH